jgi:chromosome segregation ATPase
MSGGSNIRAIGQDEAQDAQGTTKAAAEGDEAALETAAEQREFEDEWLEEEAIERPKSDRIVPSLAILSALAWTGFFGWTIQGEVLSDSVALAQWRDWVVDWSVPILLIGVGWLILRRNSRREAIKFGQTAAMLAKESADLEHRLTNTNRELSLAREFLGTQSRELESLGRVASERISTHAAELQALIQNNGQQVEAIGSTSETALANMNKLRDELPVIATSARDTTNQIGNAGRTADEQLGKLIAGFERLNQFGQASESQVASLSARITETLGQFGERLEAIETMTTERFEALTAKSEEYRTELNNREVHALTAMKQRADDLRGELSAVSGELDEQNSTALSALSARIVTLREEGGSVASELRQAEADALASLEASKTTLYDQVAEVVQMIDDLEKKAVEDARTRVQELSVEAGQFDDRLAKRDRIFHAEMSKRQDELDTRETQASELLAQRLASFDEALQERRDRQLAETEKLVGHSQEISQQLDRLNEALVAIDEHAVGTRDLIGSGLVQFDEQLESSRSQLADTGRTMETLTDSGVRLLEIIQSGARQSREDLAQAIDGTSNQLSSVETRAFMLKETLEQSNDQSAGLTQQLDTAQSKISESDQALDELQGKLAESSDDALTKLKTMKSVLAGLAEHSDALSGQTQDTLRKAIAELEQAVDAAFGAVDRGMREKLDDVASAAGANAIKALERSMRNESAEAVGRIEQSAAHASGVGREAAAQLRDQLAKVNELTGNLEQRVARARELAEEQVNNDFARRMALITDSLNSASIDIATALGSEVPDTSWDAYLKGDRGIFTRRAVNLLNTSDTREIAELYQNDDALRDNINRYIHDFEAMLRSMLSTRDGNALSVTLLGSDIGKLYVVLAQAIERFRN